MSQQSTESEDLSFSSSFSYDNRSVSDPSMSSMSLPNQNVQNPSYFSSSSNAESSISELVMFRPMIPQFLGMHHSPHPANTNIVIRQYFRFPGLLIFATSLLWEDEGSEQSSFAITEQNQAGMSKQDIKKLPIIYWNQTMQNCSQQAMCAICQTHYEPNSELRIFPCRHKFHQQCIDTWLEQKRTCPKCRLTIQICNTER